MTPKYQTSKSCRKELEYAEKLEIPCRYRADFKPFGWFGLIAAGLVWFDFRDLSDKPVNRTMNKLINYIQTNIFQKTPTVFPGKIIKISIEMIREKKIFVQISKEEHYQ